MVKSWIEQVSPLVRIERLNCRINTHTVLQWCIHVNIIWWWILISIWCYCYSKIELNVKIKNAKKRQFHLCVVLPIKGTWCKRIRNVWWMPRSFHIMQQIQIARSSRWWSVARQNPPPLSLLFQIAVRTSAHPSATFNLQHLFIIDCKYIYNTSNFGGMVSAMMWKLVLKLINAGGFLKSSHIIVVLEKLCKFINVPDYEG